MKVASGVFYNEKRSFYLPSQPVVGKNEPSTHFEFRGRARSFLRQGGVLFVLSKHVGRILTVLPSAKGEGGRKGRANVFATHRRGLLKVCTNDDDDDDAAAPAASILYRFRFAWFEN